MVGLGPTTHDFVSYSKDVYGDLILNDDASQYQPPLNCGLRFSTNAFRASFASSECCNIGLALEVSTIVASIVVSSDVRMIRLLIHCTSGGRAMILPQSSRVVSSSLSAATR